MDFIMIRLVEQLNFMGNVIKKGVTNNKNEYYERILEMYQIKKKVNDRKETKEEEKETAEKAFEEIKKEIKKRKMHFRKKNIKDAMEKIQDQFKSDQKKFFNRIKEHNCTDKKEIRTVTVQYGGEEHEKEGIISKAVKENSKPDGTEESIKESFRIKEVLQDFWNFWQDIFREKIKRKRNRS